MFSLDDFNTGSPEQRTVVGLAGQEVLGMISVRTRGGFYETGF